MGADFADFSFLHIYCNDGIAGVLARLVFRSRCLFLRLWCLRSDFPLFVKEGSSTRLALPESRATMKYQNDECHDGPRVGQSRSIDAQTSTMRKLLLDNAVQLKDNTASPRLEEWSREMAEEKEKIEGTIAGKPLSSGVKNKIQDVLKSTLQEELAKERPTVGAVGARHGSVTHGSVEAQ